MNLEKNCLLKIKNILPSLRGVEAKIATFIIEHPETVLNNPIARLASETDVAESSIIRFCRKIGYSGFSAFKINLASSIQHENAYKLDDLSLTDKPLTAPETLKLVFVQTCQALEQSMNFINTEEFSKAADLIRHASQLLLFGIGSSAPIAMDAYCRFSRLGINVSYATDPYAMLMAANHIKKGCVIIGISHTGKTKETLNAMKIAKEKGALTICISSFLNSPITNYSNVNLITSAADNSVIHEAITSRISHLAVLDSLYTYLVLSNYHFYSKELEKLDDIMNHARQ